MYDDLEHIKIIMYFNMYNIIALIETTWNVWMIKKILVYIKKQNKKKIMWLYFLLISNYN